MLGAISFSQSYLCIQTLIQSPPKIRSPTLANFYLPIPSLLVHKIILTIPTNSLFLYTSTIFHLPIFAYSHPYNLHQKYFPYLDHLANSGCVKWPVSKGVLWGLTQDSQSLIPYRISSENWCIVVSSLWWRCLQWESKAMQSTFSYPLSLLSLLPYSTNTITRTHISL